MYNLSLYWLFRHFVFTIQSTSVYFYFCHTAFPGVEFHPAFLAHGINFMLSLSKSSRNISQCPLFSILHIYTRNMTGANSDSFVTQLVILFHPDNRFHLSLKQEVIYQFSSFPWIPLLIPSFCNNL